MGYHMTLEKEKFFLGVKHREAALAAIKAIHRPEILEKQATGGRWNGEQAIERWYCFVSNDAVLKAPSLNEALGEWRWEPQCDDDGNIVSLQFIGEKLGDDIYLFEALAPFVRAGSFIVMRGEDGDIWRWYFDGKKVTEEFGRVVFRRERKAKAKDPEPDLFEKNDR